MRGRTLHRSEKSLGGGGLRASTESTLMLRLQFVSQEFPGVTGQERAIALGRGNRSLRLWRQEKRALLPVEKIKILPLDDVEDFFLWCQF